MLWQADQSLWRNKYLINDLSGVTCAAWVDGTLATRLLSTTHIFQVSTSVSIVAAMSTCCCSPTFSLAPFVAFFNSLVEYFLKACFHFKKDQFADVLIHTQTKLTRTKGV